MGVAPYDLDPPSDAALGVLVYRREFLPRSETFIVDHIRHLRRWTPSAVCDRLVASDLADAVRPGPLVLRTPEDRLRRWRLQFAGRSGELEGLVRRRKIKLIHAHFLYDGVRLAAFARQARLPMVVTAHGYDATQHLRTRLASRDGRFLLLFRHRLLQVAARIICVSDFIRAELLRQGYPADRLVTLRLGVDLQRLRPSGRPSEQRGGLFAGRLVEKKGLPYLLDAWAALPEPLRSEPLCIIGDGPLRATMELRARQLGVPAQFMGSQPHNVVLDTMRMTRVFVFPSVRAADGDAEGMGVVAMEAQALGRPVVAFNGGTGPEVLADGVSGLLATAGDTAALSEAIGRVLSLDYLADHLGLGGPRVVGERFELGRSIAALEDLYDAVVAEHATSCRVRSQ